MATNNDPFTLRHLFAWVTILAALMGIWSLANGVVDESLRRAESPISAKR